MTWETCVSLLSLLKDDLLFPFVSESALDSRVAGSWVVFALWVLLRIRGRPCTQWEWDWGGGKQLYQWSVIMHKGTVNHTRSS